MPLIHDKDIAVYLSLKMSSLFTILLKHQEGNLRTQLLLLQNSFRRKVIPALLNKKALFFKILLYCIL